MQEHQHEFEHCYRHADIETRLHCERCRKPICMSCAKVEGGQYLCPDCRGVSAESLPQQQAVPMNDSGKYVNPFRAPLTKPLLVPILIGIIGIVWLMQELSGGSTNPNTLIRFGANKGDLILAGEWWRLLTSMFLHIGIVHLLFNSFALWALGRDMEAIYGRDRFLIIYLLSGLFGSLLTFAYRGPAEFSAGASGAVFGVVGMHLAFFYFHRKRLGSAGKARMRQILQLIGINLIIGFSIVSVNNVAHIGGLIAGIILGYLLVPRHRPTLTTTGENTLVDLGTIQRLWYIPLAATVILATGLFTAITYWESIFTLSSIPFYSLSFLFG